jgi:hypothetical protein
MRGNVPGDEPGQRAGQEIILKNVNMRFSVLNENVDADGWVRFIIVKRKKPEYGYTAMFQARASHHDGENYSSDLLRITQPLNTRLYTPILDKKIRVLRKGAGEQGRSIALKKYKLRFNKKMTFEVTEDQYNILPNYAICAIVQWDDGSLTRPMALSLEMWQYYTDA